MSMEERPHQNGRSIPNHDTWPMQATLAGSHHWYIKTSLSTYQQPTPTSSHNNHISVMGVFTQVYDTPAAVPPARLFKAMTLDFHNLFPKLVDSIHSIEFTQGNGGPGTIKKITTIEGQ